MEFKPYCTQCASVKPDHVTSQYCVPCGNRGHIYRLVANESDRQDRIKLWSEYHELHGYTKSEIESIPSWVNLINIPESAKSQSL